MDLEITKILEKRSTLFYNLVSKKLKPSSNIYPVVDYRRQAARGTFVGGSPLGVLRNRMHPKDASTVSEFVFLVYLSGF